MMKHLRGGVKKGAFDEAACQQKFDAWKQAKVAATEAVEKKVPTRRRLLLLRTSRLRRRLTRLLLRRLQTRRLLPLQYRLRLRQHRLLRILLLRLLQRRHQQRHNPRSLLKHKSIDSSRVYGLFLFVIDSKVLQYGKHSHINKSFLSY